MPPGNNLPGVRDVLLLSLLWPVVCALQQPPSHNAHNAYPSQVSGLGVPSSRWDSPGGDSINTAVSDHQHRDNHLKNNKQRTSETSNQRAVAIYAPAETNRPAVGAPPAPRPVTSAGLTTRQGLARSLQDWQIEDIVLLATVDGTIHARDRTTGAHKWKLENSDLGIPDRPIVETIYHAHNKSVDEDGGEFEDSLWIVEPCQDGNIYLYAPDTGIGIQRMPFTVRQLAEKSPLASPGQPSVEYNAEKRTTLYTIDAATGKILKRSGAISSLVNDAQSCRNVNPLQSLDEEECERIGKLTLGRNEYTIGVQDGNTGQQISTIKYSDWVLNSFDVDLQSQHGTAMDSRYVYTTHNGSIYGLTFSSADEYTIPYHHKLGSPVARVFDIVRRQGDDSSDASLVVLPQPIAPPLKVQQDYPTERIFVDCTEDGSWYALSESNYPAVTDGAARSPWVTGPHSPALFSTWPNLSERQRKDFAGVHILEHAGQIQVPLLEGGADARGQPSISGHDPPRIDGKAAGFANLLSLQYLFAILAVVVVMCGTIYPKPFHFFEKKFQATGSDLQVTTTIGPKIETVNETVPMVREAEPAEETIFPHEVEGTRDSPEEPDNADDDFEKIDSNEAIEAEAAEANEGKAKKPARRGKRGGRKQKEKEQQQADARAKRANSQGIEVISVAASESPQLQGTLQINSLLVHTDKIIGQGNCGTIVFEGSFEGRDVAVKRMLSQYYELASQEVSFLQQSDDHPNVVRYFCQQKDDNFLYIAVELCQASVFEVWEAEKAKTPARQAQLQNLKLAIQQNVPRALQQLAAGLYHLHNLRIIHRDIKPQNILVAFPKRNQTQGPQLVISDFGLGKNLPENVSTLVDPTGNAGTSGWKAPELISPSADSESKHSQSNNSHTGGSENANGTTSGVKRAADIFSLGCLFFWVMTNGVHPYEHESGMQQMREYNIKHDNKRMDVLGRWEDAYEPMQLITSMLEYRPEDRPNALQVLNHPFFWPPEKRLAFLCDCSDHFEREPRGFVDDGYRDDSVHLRCLEDRAEEVIGAPFARADFLSKLDRHFVDTLGKQRKYSGNRLLDLLRALRNKKNHYEDMPQSVKERVGPLAGGYLNYWSTRFPRLLMACYEVVHDIGVEKHDRFKGYFAMEKP